jgi:hypothetical protein
MDNFTAYIASLKPVLESFFVGLIAALGDALVSALSNNQAWDWDTLKVALIAAALNYVTSKARRVEFKKVAQEPVSTSVQAELDKG